VSSVPVPPLIVAEGLDVSFFSSQDAINRTLEPWFASEAYRAFDGEGRQLKLVVERRVTPRRLLPDRVDERLVLRSVEEEPQHSGELADLLSAYLSAVSAPAASGTSLSELIRLAEEHAGIDI